MGGYGSGNYLRLSQKSTIESQYRVDVRWMKQQGYLRPGAAGTLSWSSRGDNTGSIGFRMEQDSMILNYRHRHRDGEWEEVEQVIRFDRTPCNYGGHRTWLLCPQCRKRVAVLYGAGKYFLCRYCHDLTYSSQQEGEIDRMIRKQRKIRDRLNAGDDLTEPIWLKPKGMHQKTFDRLREEVDRAHALSWALMGQKYKITDPWRP